MSPPPPPNPPPPPDPSPPPWPGTAPAPPAGAAPLPRRPHPIPPPALGPVQRRVRLLGQTLPRGRRLRARRHPERRAERAPLPLPSPVALTQRLPQSLRYLAPAFQGRPRQPDRELLAADPGRHVVAAHGLEQEPGEVHQRRVARGVAEPVVERLEAVEIGVHERAGGRAHPGHDVLEPAPVEQRGERIADRRLGERLALERRLEPRGRGADRALESCEC